MLGAETVNPLVLLAVAAIGPAIGLYGLWLQQNRERRDRHEKALLTAQSAQAENKAENTAAAFTGYEGLVQHLSAQVLGQQTENRQLQAEVRACHNREAALQERVAILERAT